MGVKKNKSVVVPNSTAEGKGNSQPTPFATEEASVALRCIQYSSGPLPPPSELEKYENVCPGAARIILDMALNEQKIRSDIAAATRDDNKRNCENEASGQRFAFWIFIGFIVGACFLGCFKMEKAACSSFGAAVAFAAGMGVRAFVSRK